MRRIGTKALGFGLLLIVGSVAMGCSGLQRGGATGDMRAALNGMTKGRLLSCAGTPDSAEVRGETEILRYFGGDNPSVHRGAEDPTAMRPGAMPSLRAESRYCEATLRVEGGRVTDVRMREARGDLFGRGRECERLFRRCLP